VVLWWLGFLNPKPWWLLSPSISHSVAMATVQTGRSPVSRGHHTAVVGLYCWPASFPTLSFSQPLFLSLGAGSQLGLNRGCSKCRGGAATPHLPSYPPLSFWWFMGLGSKGSPLSWFCCEREGAWPPFCLIFFRFSQLLV